MTLQADNLVQMVGIATIDANDAAFDETLNFVGQDYRVEIETDIEPRTFTFFGQEFHFFFGVGRVRVRRAGQIVIEGTVYGQTPGQDMSGYHGPVVFDDAKARGGYCVLHDAKPGETRVLGSLTFTPNQAIQAI